MVWDAESGVLKHVSRGEFLSQTLTLPTSASPLTSQARSFLWDLRRVQAPEVLVTQAAVLPGLGANPRDTPTLSVGADDCWPCLLPPPLLMPRLRCFLLLNSAKEIKQKADLFRYKQ